MAPLDTCFKCGKDIKYLYEGIECDLLDGAVQFTGWAGYGSANDQHEFDIYICDDCLKNRRATQITTY